MFSKAMQASLAPALELLNDDFVESVKKIKAEADQPVWLYGGSALATPLFEVGFIDKIVVKLNPVIFGAGVPIFWKNRWLRFIEVG